MRSRARPAWVCTALILACVWALFEPRPGVTTHAVEIQPAGRAMAGLGSRPRAGPARARIQARKRFLSYSVQNLFAKKHLSGDWGPMLFIETASVPTSRLFIPTGRRAGCGRRREWHASPRGGRPGLDDQGPCLQRAYGARGRVSALGRGFASPAPLLVDLASP
jgi:hypothetical protein